MKIKLLLYRALLVLWILGIFYVSLSPNPSRDFPLYASLGPMTLHIIAFFILFILFYLSFPIFKDKISLRLSTFWGLTAFISLSKEFAQLPIKGRTFSVEDLLVDAGSALAAAIMIGLFERNKA